MKTFLSVLALMFLMIAAPAFAASNANNVVGEILEVQGAGTITNAAGQTYDAVINSKVHPEDVISTGPGGRIFIQFIDNTEFTLSENAQFTVEEYSFDENDKTKNYATYSVLKGAFLYVSGLVAKKDVPDVEVNVPKGSIGIRGTKFWGGMINGEYGVIVGEGKVMVRNKGGSVTLGRGQGTTLKNRDTKPADAVVWSAEKIDLATQTISLQDPAQVGQRMAEARAEQPVLRAEHKAIAATIPRESAEVLDKKIEEKMLHVLDDISSVTPNTSAAATSTIKNVVTETKVEEPKILSVREQLKQDRLEKIEQNALRGTEKIATDTAKAATTAPANLLGATGETVKAGTETTTEVVRETVNAVGETGNRVIDSTVQTTTAVKDTATEAVKTTTETVNKVVETPVVKDTVTGVGDKVQTTVTPATNALKELRQNTLLNGNQ